MRTGTGKQLPLYVAVFVYIKVGINITSHFKMADQFVNKVTFSGKRAMARADPEFCLLLAHYEGLINDEEVML